MAQSLNITVNLRASQSGLNLRAQLFNNSFVDVGAPVTTGFSERGANGVYGWHYAAYPDGFTGGVDFFDDDTDEYLTSVMINEADFGAEAGGGASVEDILSADDLNSYPSGSVGAALGKIGVGRISVTSVVTPGGDTHLYIGDSYTAEHSNALDYTDELGNWPDLTDLDVHFYVQGLDVEAEVITPTGENKLIRVELTSAQTATLTAQKAQYSLKIVYPGVDPAPDEYVTITEGRAIIKQSP
jgi:hypothetical protein